MDGPVDMGLLKDLHKDVANQLYHHAPFLEDRGLLIATQTELDLLRNKKMEVTDPSDTYVPFLPMKKVADTRIEEMKE